MSCGKTLAEISPSIPFNASVHCGACGVDFGFRWAPPEPAQDAAAHDTRLEVRVPGFPVGRVPEDWMPNTGKPWFGPAQ